MRSCGMNVVHSNARAHTHVHWTRHDHHHPPRNEKQKCFQFACRVCSLSHPHHHDQHTISGVLKGMRWQNMTASSPFCDLTSSPDTLSPLITDAIFTTAPFHHLTRFAQPTTFYFLKLQDFGSSVLFCGRKDPVNPFTFSVVFSRLVTRCCSQVVVLPPYWQRWHRCCRPSRTQKKRVWALEASLLASRPLGTRICCLNFR